MGLSRFLEMMLEYLGVLGFLRLYFRFHASGIILEHKRKYNNDFLVGILVGVLFDVFLGSLVRNGFRF